MANNQELQQRKSRLEKRLYAKLATWEIVLWTSLWIFGVGYSMLHVYWASKRYWRFLYQDDFEVGFFPTSRKDISDTEWMIFSKNMLDSIPWLALHLLGTQYFQRCHQNVIPLFHTLLPLLYLTRALNSSKPVLLLLAQPLALFVTLQSIQNQLCNAFPKLQAFLIWLVAILIIVFNDSWPIQALKEWSFEDSSWQAKYITHVTMFWINSRCVSFCLDHVWKDVPEEPLIWKKWFQLLGYCFYLPLGIQGPLINYKDYHVGIFSHPKPWTWPRLKEFALLITRYAFWYLAVELWLHFLYTSALKLEVKLLGKMDLWTIAGLGFSMGQFFMMKYTFFYGFTRPFVKSDGVEPPNHPKCIARIHLYSDMWRHFDAGLHKFMHRYIYQPVISGRNSLMFQLLAAIVCFAFVYIWHGIMDNILRWSLLNFAGIVLETLARAIWKWEPYNKLEKSFLSSRGQRRWHALLSAPLYLMSIVSNMYFLFGLEAGHVFMSKGFTSWPWGTPTTLLFMYCGAQTSIEVKNYEIWRELDKLSHEHIH